MHEPSPPPDGPAAAPKTVLLGDYRLTRRLGHGGMGHVYKARQLSLDRDVAVKVLYRHMAAQPQVVRRFVREARLLARLSHPNIVGCYGVGKAQGRYFLAMEYIDGHNALQWLRRLSRFRVGDALHVGLACARALEYAHARGLIHRDIKPDNLLIGRDGAVKLGDLGLARSVEDELALTQTGQGAGTPVYMAPEQARNARHVDHRCDLYALGCTLYHLLTGSLPFPGATVLEVVLAKMKGEYRSARRLNPEVPARLDRTLARLLAPFPDDRYPSTAALIADLAALGMAHPQLSFLPTPAPTPAVLHDLSVPEVKAAAPDWYVIYRNAAGCWVSRLMSTAEVCATAEGDDDFARTAQASPRAQGEYRALETLPDFAAAFRVRRKRARAQRQAVELAAEVEQVTAAERRRRWAWLWRLLGLAAARP